MPQYINELFKYRIFNQRTLLMLVNEGFYIPTAGQLNDPFDAVFKLSTIEPTKAQVLEVAEKCLTAAKYQLFISMTEKMFDGERPAASIRARINEYSEVLHRESEHLGVLSLSESDTISSMWSLYGDEHKGVCFGFDIDELFSKSPYTRSDWLARVEYLEESKIVRNAYIFYMMSFSGKLNDYHEFVRRNFYLKSENWKHEREWRVVAPAMGGQTYKLNLTAIKSVTFGLKTDPDYKSATLRILSNKGFRPNYYQMTRSTYIAALEKHKMTVNDRYWLNAAD